MLRKSLKRKQWSKCWRMSYGVLTYHKYPTILISLRRLPQSFWYSITTYNVCSLSLSCATDITITQYFSIYVFASYIYLKYVLPLQCFCPNSCSCFIPLGYVPWYNGRFVIRILVKKGHGSCFYLVWTMLPAGRRNVKLETTNIFSKST
jgi:hypothetical protein